MIASLSALSRIAHPTVTVASSAIPKLPSPMRISVNSSSVGKSFEEHPAASSVFRMASRRNVDLTVIPRRPWACYAPPMSDKESDQRRDALLLRLLKTPPQPRGERKRPRVKATKEIRVESTASTGDAR